MVRRVLGTTASCTIMLRRAGQAVQGSQRPPLEGFVWAPMHSQCYANEAQNRPVEYWTISGG